MSTNPQATPRTPSDGSGAAASPTGHTPSASTRGRGRGRGRSSRNRQGNSPRTHRQETPGSSQTSSLEVPMVPSLETRLAAIDANTSGVLNGLNRHIHATTDQYGALEDHMASIQQDTPGIISSQLDEKLVELFHTLGEHRTAIDQVKGRSSVFSSYLLTQRNELGTARAQLRELHDKTDQDFINIQQLLHELKQPRQEPSEPTEDQRRERSEANTPATGSRAPTPPESSPPNHESPPSHHARTAQTDVDSGSEEPELGAILATALAEHGDIQ